ncbi:MAG: ABC transporter ATP-binding protein [Candidatus Cloacimonetes bacterium]|nr:ABC transporter ATP-binding protein [Candidatus Cloacimonadota bacterium]
MSKLPSKAKPIILEARGITKSFLFQHKISTVLKEVDFCIYDGEFVSIIGSSGCGKSTFLELLAGISKPDNGQIHLNQQDITGKAGFLGYMPQDDLLFPWLNTMQNILLPIKVRSGNLAEAKGQVMELLPMFGLENHAQHLPNQLSGGLRQRVALLRTYMTNAKVLLLDEPLASLDSLTRSQLQTWLKDIVRLLNLTVILVTHDIDEAISLSDRIELMTKDPGTFSQSIDIVAMGKLNDTDQLALKGKIKSLFT